MRVNEAAGLYMQHEDVSPETFKAQRMAELEQIARYRAKRLAQYQTWSDPVQREQIKAKLAEEMRAAKEAVAGQTVHLPPLGKLTDRVRLTEVRKPKEGWLKRFIREFKQAFRDIVQI